MLHCIQDEAQSPYSASRASLPSTGFFMLPTPASSFISGPHFSPPKSLSSLCLCLSPQQPYPRNLWFLAISTLVIYFHQAFPCLICPTPTSFIFICFTWLTNTSRVTFSKEPPLKTPRLNCVPCILCYHSFIHYIALQYNCWLVCQFPPFISMLSEGRNCGFVYLWTAGA